MPTVNNILKLQNDAWQSYTHVEQSLKPLTSQKPLSAGKFLERFFERQQQNYQHNKNHWHYDKLWGNNYAEKSMH